jgi:hypothetical protein
MLHVAAVHLFSFLSNIPLSEYTITFLIHSPIKVYLGYF